ncbi:hypothetical protein PHSY_003405 [Pseudozyma hubeiensis SY62]|uniref:Uncharacterized protein n=1 Tax=Pseudozyma hubeiensis (strain SY62) TaxID=1305764 RepID=R9P339_PSEHS|nr:hypothetical protein PHSY_003405 [Pseudozyma hubeiensis SY62]GAC95828.1 hypothetical protein PHSY_003405 [Pseudozyma hubeiensis SY62]
MASGSPIPSPGPEFLSPFSSSAIDMSPRYGNSCALTILKGDADHPISAHSPIHRKLDPSSSRSSPSQASRFATSFSDIRSSSKGASSGFDSSVNVHAISDHGILLPFLDRPTEVKELLFDTKANEALLYKLCSVFGGNLDQPTQRGKDERWDEMLELLIELDRPLLDDEDWLIRLELLVMERSPSLWAQLARCLGAEGLTLHPAIQPGSSRFDSWALPSRYMDASHDNDSPLSPPSAASSDDDDGQNDDRVVERSLSIDLEPLRALPSSYSEQSAAKMRRSSLYDPVSPATQQPPLSSSESAGAIVSPTSGGSPGDGGGDTAMTGLLEDIMEEPQSSPQMEVGVGSRRRSHSGKFAGLRISALSSSGNSAVRRSSCASSTASTSPLPTGVMSPAGLAPESPGAAPSRESSTSFAKHRRLSMIMVHNRPESQHEPHGHPHGKLDLDKVPSPRRSPSRRQRGVSEASQTFSGHHAPPAQQRRRAQSFARSFAELASPTMHLEKLRADHAQGKDERLAAEGLTESTRRMSLQQPLHPSVSSAPVGATSGLGLDASLGSPPSLSLTSGKTRKATAGRKRLGRSGSRGAASSTGSSSPPIPGLLPDGRTRHPSGSCGSRDLAESIEAFRNSMGLSTSPSPSERDFADTVEEKSTESATRKRKDIGVADLPQPTSKTVETAEAKVSRKGSPPATRASFEEHQAQFEKPKHMQELENRGQGSNKSGSGLALGGGFSLAKSGANFRGQGHDVMSGAHDGWRSSFSRRDGTRTRGSDHFSLRSPPAVQRRPGGFVSLAQEYERARRDRRSSEVAYSINSNALESSPSSSLASFDIGGGGDHHRRRSSEESLPRLELPGTAGGEAKGKSGTPDFERGDPTPKAGPGGGMTPRASFGGSSTRLQGYPFPNLANRMTAPAAAHDAGAKEVSTPGRSRNSLGPATPLSPLHACQDLLSPTRTPSSTSTQSSPRSPSIVFPISPNPSISRAQEFKKALETPACQTAFARIHTTCGSTAEASIRELITTCERSHMSDESLLEEVGRRIGLVDHEHAQAVGGRVAEEADQVLAEEGYEDKWEVFEALCRSLGMGNVELGLARRRCGPAVDTCRQE